MPTVFLFSRDGRLIEPVIRPLSNAGYDTAIVTDALQVSACIVDGKPDLVLIDTHALGQRELVEILDSCKQLRIASLCLVNRDSLTEYDAGNGADDFLLDPLFWPELEVRVHQLLCRGQSPNNDQTIRVGELVINQNRYEVRLSGSKLLLTYKEYQLLRLLASSPGTVFSREELLSKIWGFDYFGGTRTVDVHIRRLRSKLEATDHTYIETIWNVGYRMQEP